MELFRAAVLHTPRNPFQHPAALEAWPDGALAVDAGRVAACGDYADLARRFPQAALHDWRGGFVLPGFVDTHVHYPQVRIMGALGYQLLDWLRENTLPEEARFADETYAATVAGEFVDGLLAHGTTAALVFAAHFAPATACLFDAAARRGLRLTSGLVMSDRHLRDELHQSPDAAYRLAQDLIGRYHGRRRARYAVTPRFALSCSEGMLEVCRALLAGHEGLFFQTHINENAGEIAAVAREFPGQPDYLSVYDHYGLVGERSVFAHDLHATGAELACLAERRASIAHCPCSNAALGSGFFPMARHIRAGVRVALGTDVGGGTGFGLMKEAFQAYLLQRLAPDGYPLTSAHLLWLATRAGAEALALEAGDFQPGRLADFVHWRPPARSTLAAVLAHAEAPERQLSALFTLAGAESVRAVYIEGEPVA